MSCLYSPEPFNTGGQSRCPPAPPPRTPQPPLTDLFNHMGQSPGIRDDMSDSTSKPVCENLFRINLYLKLVIKFFFNYRQN